MGQWGRIALGVVLAVAMALGMCPAQVRAEEVVEVASVGESEGVQPQDTAENDDVQLEAQYADVVEVTITGIESPQEPQCSGDLVVALRLLYSTFHSTVTLKLLHDTTVTQDYSGPFNLHQVNTTIDLNGHAVDMTNHELKVARGYTAPTLTITDTAGGGVLDNCCILVDANTEDSIDPNRANLVMCGGTINGCVKVSRTHDQYRRAEFLMTNGTITNKNGAMVNGVGVDVGGSHASTFAMTGGSVTGCVGGGVTVGANGTLKVSGTPKITDNVKNGQACNVYLPVGKTIAVAGALADGARVGVRTQNEPTVDSPVTFTSGFGEHNSGDDPARFFVSDDPRYYVALEGGEAVLKPHTHAWQWEASGNVLTATCRNDNCTADGGNKQTLTLVAKDKTYDGRPVGATVQASAGWEATGAAAGDVAYYAGGKQLAAAPKDAGAYEARVSVSAAGTTYELVAPFSIKKAPLTVAARDNAVTFGEAPAGAGVTYSGFAAGEGKQVLSGTLAYDFGGCQTDSPVGTYPITPSGLRASNYDIVYKAGTLTVCAPDACAVTAVAHVQRKGTLEPSTGVGEVVGTTGSSLRLESLRLSLFGQQLPGGLEYRAHVQRIGWQGWVADGALAGTQGKSRRVEAFQMRLTGRMAECYDVYYRVHAQRYGWMAWAKNGESAGTQGRSLRVEAVQVVVVRKGSPAPGTTYHGVVQTYTKPFVKR
ncbi:MAG: MBG domain-containing protein [Coriobacteriales bacterium]|nr:MBG domain-containing protein [Coriobacteriales bacterium]